MTQAADAQQVYMHMCVWHWGCKGKHAFLLGCPGMLGAGDLGTCFR